MIADCQQRPVGVGSAGANVALTHDNADALRREADKINTQLEPDQLPPLLQARLVRRRDGIQAVLEGTSPAS